MKLRLLNASHQAMCYLGYLSGYRYAHEVCQDPLFTSFLLAYMDREATPTLPPGRPHQRERRSGRRLPPTEGQARVDDRLGEQVL